MRLLRIWLLAVPAVVLPAVSSAEAKTRFAESLVQGKSEEIIFCDLDGNGLKDIVLVDGSDLAVFYQDAREGFAEKPHQVHSLGDKPSVVWAARLGKDAESLLVMTSEGVSELDFTSKTAPPTGTKIVNQQTVVPEKATGPAVVHFPLSAETKTNWPVLLVPARDELQVWCRKDAWQHVQSLKDVLDTAVGAFVEGPGYTKSTRVDTNLGDVNGDGRDDLVAHTRDVQTEAYAVYCQRPDGMFAAEPAPTYAAPQDWSWFGWVDINNDGHVDMIKGKWLYEPWFIPGTRSGKVLVSVYLADERGRIPPEPQQVFRKNDWIDSIPVVDVDGDGYIDLVLGYSAFDTREGFRKAFMAKQLDFSLRFHFYRPGRGFPESPDCDRDLLIRLDEHSINLTWSRRRYFDRFVDLSGDFDGDGDVDLLVRDRSEGVSVYPFVSRRVGFDQKATARFDYREPIERFVVRDLNNDGTSDLIMKLSKREAFRIHLSRRR